MKSSGVSVAYRHLADMKPNTACLIVPIATLLLAYVSAKDSLLPKTWLVCKRNDKNLNICMKNAISGAVKELSHGNSKLGVPPIEPMHFDSLTVDQGSGAVGVRLQFTNLFIHGLSKAVVDKARVDYDKFEIDIDFHVDSKVRIQGDYISSGRVLVIPISGVGKCNLTFDNFKGRVSLRGKELQKNGESYFLVHKTDISIDTTRLYLNFKRTNQNAISNILNRFLNDNWKEILNDMKPAISKSFGSNIKDVANTVFSKIPLSVLAP